MTVEIFCKVVDNYGDAGVCGRLARQLAVEHGHKVRLWIDLPDVLAELRIALPEQIEVHKWDSTFAAPADFGPVVIEAFACTTPPAAITAMQKMAKPVWINLEYLSTESWAADNHLLPSTSPSTGLVQHFAFPGFWPGTGGLLRERGLLAQRDAYQAGLPAHSGLRLSLFCYKWAPLDPLLQALAQHSQPVTLLMPHNLLPELEVPAGNLTLERFPFLPQAEYDHLLWRCDVNLVRGEDSFVRANWAGKPLIWQAYPEAGDQQEAKIAGFLKRYTEKMTPECAETLALVHKVWNLPGLDAGQAWPRLLEHLPELAAHARAWATELAKQADLASQLAAFIEKKRIET